MSAFLLLSSLRYSRIIDRADWVRRASEASAFLSSAISHHPVAMHLLRSNLVMEAGEFIPSSKLASVGKRADKGTLLQLAAILIEAEPPSWLWAAVRGVTVSRELIPHADLRQLSWMEPHLDLILIGAYRRLQTEGDRARELGIGRAAELVAMEALRIEHRMPTLVADSAGFAGYDIACDQGDTRFWEIKGCTSKTRGEFHLSRNEYDVACHNHDEWKLLQVEFRSSILMSDTITGADVAGLWVLMAVDIERIAPKEAGMFRWEESARFHPPTACWRPWLPGTEMRVTLPALTYLAAEATSIRESQ
ncbi:DUF3883 domain-containing protein [Curtobacterium sp. BH-2-1-1]|uniref:DUF3883 domain-containing protein n=1 Tax=Curtobacterium sp. BH-2-1-1 TaxID=1905847 RepID=UPI0015E17843|nr:DUF3883 domain-containing protein [Curtobacterium sp. BH-2-1-1]